MSIGLVFWVMVMVFALVGSLRGWAKELLVSFSLVLALFVNLLLEKYAHNILASLRVVDLFWVKAAVFSGLAYFGYLTPRIPWLPSNRFIREHLQDWLLGMIIGGLNGAILFGSLWFFVHQAGYPFAGMEFARQTATDPQVVALMRYMPPMLLGETWLLIAVAIAFVFVIVVFV